MEYEPKLQKYIQEFLDHEFEDYGFESKIEFQENSGDTEYYNITVTDGRMIENKVGKGCITLSIIPEQEVINIEEYSDCKIEVELGEDSWYEVETWNRNIKYLRMALLNRN